MFECEMRDNSYCTCSDHTAQFIDLYPVDMDTNTVSDHSLRRMFCDFLASSLLIMLAREEDVIEDQVHFTKNMIF